MPVYTISSRHVGALLAQDRFPYTGDFAGAVEACRQAYAQTGRQTCVHDDGLRLIFKVFTSGNEVCYVGDALFRATEATHNA